MAADFEAVLDECLARIESGESAETCLRAYPALADELRPLLAMARGLRTVPAPRARPEAVAAGKQRVLAAFSAERSRRGAPSNPLQRLAARLAGILRFGPVTHSRYALRFALGILIALGLGTTSAVAASARSLPGDVLYPVKQSVESLRLALAFDSQSKQALKTQFDSQRLLEIQSLVQMRRQTTVEFEDMLQAIGDNGWWTIGPFAVQVNDGTVVLGQPQPGGRVRVQVRIQENGTLAALHVSEETDHSAEHQSGLDGMQFASPIPAATPTHEAEHELLTTETHQEDTEDKRDHEIEPEHDLQGHHPAPTATAAIRPTQAVPTVQDTPLPTQRLEPTAAPTAMPAQPMEPTAEPEHQEPAHMPQEHHDGGSDSDDGGQKHDPKDHH